MADLRGKIIGDKQVIKAINFMPETFIGFLSIWMQNEGGRFIGTRGAKGKNFTKGYRNAIKKRRLKRRPGYWASQIAGLFRWDLPFAKRVNDLTLTMGVMRKGRHQLKEALEFLSQGGTITSSSEMPIPMYKNLKTSGYRGGISEGSVKTGLKSKAFRKHIETGKLVGLKKGGNTYYFNKDAQRNNRGKFSRSDLLFIGVHSITVRKMLTGRLDFKAQFNKKKGKMVERGQRAVDRATKKVEKQMSKL